jgi:hypothetical protein
MRLGSLNFVPVNRGQSIIQLKSVAVKKQPNPVCFGAAVGSFSPALAPNPRTVRRASLPLPGACGLN